MMNPTLKSKLGSALRTLSMVAVIVSLVLAAAAMPAAAANTGTVANEDHVDDDEGADYENDTDRDDGPDVPLKLQPTPRAIQGSPGDVVTIEYMLLNRGNETIYAPSTTIESLPDGWRIVGHDDDRGAYHETRRFWIWGALNPGQKVEPSLDVRIPNDTDPGRYAVDAFADEPDRRIDAGNATVVVTPMGTGGQNISNNTNRSNDGGNGPPGHANDGGNGPPERTSNGSDTGNDKNGNAAGNGNGADGNNGNGISTGNGKVMFNQPLSPDRPTTFVVWLGDQRVHWP